MARHGRAVIPWGKYKGVRIRLLPNDYLSWLTTLKLMRSQQWRWLWDSVIAELKFRGLNAELAETDEPIVELPDLPKPVMRKIRVEMLK